MTAKAITIVAITVVALGVAVGTAYRSDEREPAKRPAAVAPHAQTPQAMAPPTQPLRAGDHYVQLEQAVERALLARDPRERETAFSVLLPELLQSDPQRAIAVWQRQAPGEPRDALRDEMARQWIRLDREAALGWLKSLEEAAGRAQAAQVAVASLAAFAPDQAIYAADQLGVGRDNGYLEHLVQIWAETSLADAERWLATQPDDARTAPLRARIERVRDQRMAAGRG